MDKKVSNENCSTEQKIVKPLILEIEEAKRETSNAINAILAKHGLPCYLYEPIIDEVHKQISAMAKNEISSVASEYAKLAQTEGAKETDNPTENK